MDNPQNTTIFVSPSPTRKSTDVDSGTTTNNDKSSPNRRRWRLAAYIGAWYFFSISISFYNKNMLGRDKWDLEFPFLMTAIHALMHYVISSALIRCFPEKFGERRTKKLGREPSYPKRVIPCALAAAMEIGLANASLIYITLSFYTMVKSSTPIYVLLFAFLAGLEKPRLSLIAIITVIITGVLLTIFGETQFNLAGFLLVLGASVISGLRWVLTELLMRGTSGPVRTLNQLAPLMCIFMLIFSLCTEDPWTQIRTSRHFATLNAILETLALMAAGGILAFCMMMAELFLIQASNTLTLSVAGICKEIVVVLLSVVVYGDQLNAVNVIGLIISIAGIYGYNLWRNEQKIDYLPLHKRENTS
ncbi:uncharacterized protein VTP21DRAFT_658 [Calcarisporiella thermophila]|uniref:uncharacterized protein n=1 Tax=Calcarisporiella thermophila TaxID=911321 RepID=UPI0037436811